MAAFKDSAYGSDSVSNLMAELSASVLKVKKRDKDEESDRIERSDFLRKEQERGGRAMEIYYEDEVIY
jgi:hypothetical protein